jgi:hypothetical protein
MTIWISYTPMLFIKFFRNEVGREDRGLKHLSDCLPLYLLIYKKELGNVHLL